MGVKGLTTLLQRLAPEAVRTHHISHYKGKSLAIDVSCFLNRFIYTIDPHPARVQRGLHRLCLYLHLHDIQPIFVFDGPDRIIEKEQEGIRREAMKEKVKKSFQLEKIRKTRLKGLKGSAQILQDFSTEEVVSILEDMRKQDDGEGSVGHVPVTPAVSATPDVGSEGESAGSKSKTPAIPTVVKTESAKTSPRPGSMITTQTAQTAPTAPTASPKRPSITTPTKKSPSDRSSKGLYPQEELHLAKMYDLLEEDLIWVDEESSWTIPTLPDDFYRRLEQEHAKLLTTHGSGSYSTDTIKTSPTPEMEFEQLSGILGGTDEEELEGYDVFERELDMLDRMELDVDTLDGMDVIYDLSDLATEPIGDEDGARHPLPLVLKTGTSIHNLISSSDSPHIHPESTSLEGDSVALKKRVQMVLEEYIRSTERSTEDAELEELTLTSTRKQKALDEMEQKLVQEIKEYTGMETQMDPVLELEESMEPNSVILLPRGILSAELAQRDVEDMLPKEEVVITATTTNDDSIQGVTPTVDTEPVWSIDSDPGDIAAAEREDDPVVMIEEATNINQDIETATLAQESDQDLKSMIHSVLSAHRQIFMTLERRTLRVTRPLVLSCQHLLVAMGEPVIEAKDAEAEAVCAQLTTLGLTDASVSEDTDTAVFGNGLLLRQVGATGDRDIIEINPVVAREQLGLSRDAFRDLCILCGTDFSGTIEGIGPRRAAKLIQYYGSIESIMANSGYKPRPDFVYDRARRVFDRTPIVPLDPAAYKPKPQIQPLLLELLLKYDINPQEVKEELLQGPKAEIEGVDTVPAFSQGTSSRALGGSTGMGIDPFQATIVIPSRSDQSAISHK